MFSTSVKGCRRSAPVAWIALCLAPLLMSGNGIAAGAGGSQGLMSSEPPDVKSDYAADRLIVKFKSSVGAGRELQLVTSTGVGSLVAQGQRLLSGLNAAERSALSQVGGTVLRGHERLGILVIRPRLAVGAAVESLLRSGTVAYAEPDYRLRASAVPDDPQFGQQWSLHNIGQEVPAGSGRFGTSDADIDGMEAWDVQKIAPGVVVAVMDTGVDYRHPDLALNMWVNPGEVAGNGIDDDGNGWVDDVHGIDTCNYDSDPDDDYRYAHGTHVAGIVGARGDNGVGVTGVAWRTKIMALKFLCADGGGYDSGAVALIDYLLAVKAAHGYTRVIMNASWGGSGDSAALEDAIDTAGDEGVLMVAAAGNAGMDTDVTPVYPASYGLVNVLSVGASDSNDAPAYFSNHGCNSVDVYAPGVDILSTVLHTAKGYASYSGTSMAAPLVSGMAALVWQRHATRSLPQVKAMLMNSVDPVGTLEGQAVTQGRVNLQQALGAPWNVPVVWDVSPALITPGGSITIRGSNFGTSAGSASIAGTALTITRWSAEEIVAGVPYSAPLGVHHVQIGNAAGRSSRAGGCLSVSYQPVLAGRLLVARAHAAAAQVGNDLYVIGGLADWGPTGLVERYTLNTNRSAIDTSRSMPHPAAYAGAAAIDGRIHVAGGTDQDTGEIFDHLQIYDTATGTWRAGKPLPEPRFRAAVAAVNGKLFVIGGADQSHRATATTYIYDPPNDTWSQGAPIPEGRVHAGAVRQGTSNMIWVMGGFKGAPFASEQSNSVYVYNTAIDRWTMRPPMNATRAGFAPIFRSIRAILAMHGVGSLNGSYVSGRSDGEFYDGSRWRNDITGSQSLYGPLAGRVGKDVYVAAGYDSSSHTPSANVWRLRFH